MPGRIEGILCRNIGRYTFDWINTITSLQNSSFHSYNIAFALLFDNVTYVVFGMDWSVGVSNFHMKLL